jgi:hypothetical protein
MKNGGVLTHHTAFNGGDDFAVQRVAARWPEGHFVSNAEDHTTAAN